MCKLLDNIRFVIRSKTSVFLLIEITVSRILVNRDSNFRNKSEKYMSFDVDALQITTAIFHRAPRPKF